MHQEGRQEAGGFSGEVSRPKFIVWASWLLRTLGAPYAERYGYKKIRIDQWMITNC